MADTCAHCQKTASEVGNLKACAKCQTTRYCSRDCQKAHWKEHKKICSKNAASRSAASNASASNTEHNTSYESPAVTNLQKQIPNPFTRLDKHTYLHDRPEEDVYKLLIDSFRLRQEDNFVHEGKTDAKSVYSGAASSIEGFRKYLQLASSRSKVLPPWWDADKQKDCEDLGESDTEWSNLKHKVKKQDLVDRYGDQKMPMQLRMMAEIVYGRGPGGQDGTGMRRMMMNMEANNGVEGQEVMSMLSL